MPLRLLWYQTIVQASENRHLIQIAPFRVIFAGQAMVDIFFIVSGYSISTGLIKLRKDGSLSDFYRKLTSSVVRRIFRLCFPVVVIMLLSHLIFYSGLYALEFGPEQGCPGAKPWSSPFPHMQCLMRSIFGIINLQSNQELTLNNHFWTIPVEIRGSMKVYLALLGFSTISPRARSLGVGVLVARAWWNGSPEFLAFFMGLLFAELDTCGSLERSNFNLPSPITSWNASKWTFAGPRFSQISTCAWYCIFSLGIYLICLPAPVWREGVPTPIFSPDWIFTTVLPPLPWWHWEVEMRTWHTIGAILVVSGIRSLPSLKIPFESRVAQFLGYISFSLYLCHQTVYRILLSRLLNWTSFFLSGINFWDAKGQQRNGTVFVAWVVATALIGTILMLVSRYMARAVDQKSVSIGFQVERILSRL